MGVAGHPGDVATNTFEIRAPREDVFAVLNDPCAYSEWVVGPRRVVRADAEWPRPGSSFVHEESVGPKTVRDETELLGEDPPRHLALRAKARPFGAVAVITFDLDEAGAGTRITMTERPIEGPLAAIWNPLFDSLLWLRNEIALRRLRDVVLRRAKRQLP